jgi:DNA-binding NarL/FixJ family response regulator
MERSSGRTRPDERPDDDGPVRVLTVDDRAPFLAAARAVLDATPGFRSVGEATSGPEALALAADVHPDLALVDVNMPGMDGLELCRRLVDGFPRICVVLVSADDDLALRHAPDRCQAAAFIRKQDLRPALLRHTWERHRAGR